MNTDALGTLSPIDKIAYWKGTQLRKYLHDHVETKALTDSEYQRLKNLVDEVIVPALASDASHTIPLRSLQTDQDYLGGAEPSTRNLCGPALGIQTALEWAGIGQVCFERVDADDSPPQYYLCVQTKPKLQKA